MRAKGALAPLALIPQEIQRNGCTDIKHSTTGNL